jgi:hypothetical protein
MSKKRNARGRRSGDQTVAPAPAIPTPSLRASASRRTSPEEFAEEYSYVAQDLRRIAILAVIMFAIMIGLNLFLH